MYTHTLRYIITVMKSLAFKRPDKLKVSDFNEKTLKVLMNRTIMEPKIN